MLSVIPNTPVSSAKPAVTPDALSNTNLPNIPKDKTHPVTVTERKLFSKLPTPSSL